MVETQPCFYPTRGGPISGPLRPASLSPCPGTGRWCLTRLRWVEDRSLEREMKAVEVVGLFTVSATLRPGPWFERGRRPRFPQPHVYTLVIGCTVVRRERGCTENMGGGGWRPEG